MIMFALVWWCYPIVAASVAVPMAFFWLIENRKEAREEREAGPFPCLAYLGRDVEVGELWCWLIHGHDGEHEDQFELPETAFTREWPDEEDVILPALPQRLSKVPAQTKHTPNQQWPGCEHQSSDGRCRLVKSHIGPHEYIRQPQGPAPGK